MKSPHEDLEEKFVKMSLLVGVIIGRLSGLMASPYVSLESKGQINDLINYIEPKVEEIYYPEKTAIEQKICPFCNTIHKHDTKCSRRIVIDEPKAEEKNNAEEFAKEFIASKGKLALCTVCGKYHVGTAPCATLSGTWPPNCS